LEEASIEASAYRLRLLFVVLLSHCEVQDPSGLFEQFWRQMSVFWLRSHTEDEAKLFCREWIRRRVRANYGNVDDPLFDGIPDGMQVPPEYDVPAPSPSLVAAQGEKRASAKNTTFLDVYDDLCSS
jgi:hypothetical protein